MADGCAPLDPKHVRHSFIVYKDSNKHRTSWRSFLRELGLELIKGLLQHRKNNMYLPKELCKRIPEQTGEQTGETSQEPLEKTEHKMSHVSYQTRKQNPRVGVMCVLLDRKTKSQGQGQAIRVKKTCVLFLCENCLRYDNSSKDYFCSSFIFIVIVVHIEIFQIQ